MLSAATPSARAPLAEFGYDVTDVTVDDLLTKKILIRQYCLQTDIHPFVRGAVFDGVWAKRVPGTIGETPVDFASLDDLITKKKAAGQLVGSPCDRREGRADLRASTSSANRRKQSSAVIRRSRARLGGGPCCA